MKHPPIVYGTHRTLDDPPPSTSYDLASWAVVLIVTLLLAVALAPTPARAETLTRDEVAEIASHYWPAREVPRVVRTAVCESGLDTHAVSAGWDRVFGRYEYLSLMQVEKNLWQAHADRIMGYPTDLRDPVVNIAVSAFIWSNGGWNHWPVCGFR